MAYGPDTKQLMRQLRARESYLNLYGLQIHSLPPLPQGLRVLRCWKSELTSLPELPYGIKTLDCTNTKITALPPLPDTLEALYCEETPLTILPRLPRRLRILECSSEKLVLPIGVGETIDSYRARWNAWWDEKEERERAEARCEAIKEELMTAAWAPARVERWLDAGIELEAM